MSYDRNHSTNHQKIEETEIHNYFEAQGIRDDKENKKSITKACLF